MDVIRTDGKYEIAVGSDLTPVAAQEWMETVRARNGGQGTYELRATPQPAPRTPEPPMAYDPTDPRIVHDHEEE